LVDLTPRDLLEHISPSKRSSPKLRRSAFPRRSRDLKRRQRTAHGNCIITSVDILNPVQVSAAGMDPKVLKREFGRDITFWGGGCDSQAILPFGTPDEVADQVKRRIDDLAPGGGFVFSPIHNVQTGVPPENVVAMFETAREYGVYHGLARWWQAVDRLGARHLSEPC
jgi:hypothetical protein